MIWHKGKPDKSGLYAVIIDNGFRLRVETFSYSAAWSLWNTNDKFSKEEAEAYSMDDYVVAWTEISNLIPKDLKGETI